MKSLAERVAEIPYWYHRIELPGVVTPGWAPLSLESYRVPLDLRGMRILDIGSWDGFWTFEALKRGAREVVAIDDFSDPANFLGKDLVPWKSFDLCREALGFSEQQCPRFDMSIYDVSDETLGQFDVVFCFGTIYHCRYPLLALDKISAVCKDSLYVESAVLDYYSPYQKPEEIDRTYAGAQYVMEFYAEKQYGDQPTNWWVPTLHCLGQMIRASGFPEVYCWPLTPEPREVPHCRGFVRAEKR